MREKWRKKRMRRLRRKRRQNRNWSLPWSQSSLTTYPCIIHPHIIRITTQLTWIILNKKSSEVHRTQTITFLLRFRLVRKYIPETKSFISCPCHYRLPTWIHRQKEHSTCVACEGSCFLERRIVPHYYFVIGISMSTDYLFCVFRKHQITNLRSSVNTIQKTSIKRIPKFNCSISWSSPRS